MELTKQVEKKGLTLQGCLRVTILILSLILIGTISYDTFEYNNPFYASPTYIKVQFWVCIFFLIDLILEFIFTKHKKKYMFRYALLFLVCIPYPSILPYITFDIPHEFAYFLRFAPLIRSAYALAIVVGWFTFNKTSMMFFTYLVILVTCIYLGSLFFFVCEVNINPLVKAYSDALWWATMEAVTVGSNIEAVTPGGKVVSVIVAIIGMLMFPMFTVYVTNIIGTFKEVTKEVSGKADLETDDENPSADNTKNEKKDEKKTPNS